MKKTTLLKASVLSVAMALGMLSPMSASAQRDDLLRVDDSFNGTRDDVGVTWAIVNNGIGQSEAPLGSGLLVLGAAGAGYALARRRSRKQNKSHLKGAAALLALAVTLCFTQCRKDVDTVTGAVTNGVHITLSVDNGSRVAVDPTNGGANDYATVTWEDGDILYVGNNGAYCGYLTYDGTNFTGTITPTAADDDDYLHFYFMGNKGTTSEPTSVNITDQTSKYPVISYGHSTVNYSSGTTSYSATLYNKCAIVKFTTTDIDADITVSGMKNTVTVDFAANNGATTGEPYSFSKSGDGDITLHKVSNTERWAILLPQDAVENPTVTISGYTCSLASVPAITENAYLNTGLSITMAVTSDIDAAYTVASGTTVKFAQGNLVAVSDGVYGFDANQYDVHTDVPTISSGYPRYYFTWSEIASSSDNPVSFTIGGSTYKTLTYAQWRYVLGLDGIARGGTSVSASGHFYAKAVVNGINGLILLPDNWSDSYYTLSYYNTTTSAFTGNTITSDQWATLESKGCVFLPMAGTSNGYSVSNAATVSRYWSCTVRDDSNAFYLGFNSSRVSMTDLEGNKTNGRSVRLVRFE